MKKLILALCLLLMVSVGAAGEEMQTETAPTVAEIALTMRPESEEPTHLTVGNSTKVSGSLLTSLGMWCGISAAVLGLSVRLPSRFLSPTKRWREWAWRYVRWKFLTRWAIPSALWTA